MHKVYFVIIVHTGLSNPADKKKRDLEIFVSFQYRLYDQTEGSESLVHHFHRHRATCKSARVSIYDVDKVAGFPKLHSLVTSSKQPSLHLMYKSGSDDVSERCNLCT